VKIVNKRGTIDCLMNLLDPQRINSRPMKHKNYNIYFLLLIYIMSLNLLFSLNFTKVASYIFSTNIVFSFLKKYIEDILKID